MIEKLNIDAKKLHSVYGGKPKGIQTIEKILQSLLVQDVREFKSLSRTARSAFLMDKMQSLSAQEVKCLHEIVKSTLHKNAHRKIVTRLPDVKRFYKESLAVMAGNNVQKELSAHIEAPNAIIAGNVMPKFGR